MIVRRVTDVWVTNVVKSKGAIPKDSALGGRQPGHKCFLASLLQKYAEKVPPVSKIMLFVRVNKVSCGARKCRL